MLSGYLSVAMASQKASFNNNQSTTTLVFLSSSFRKRKVKYPPHGACYLETRIIESLTIGNLKHSETKPPHSVQSPDTPLSTHFSNTPQSANGTTHIDTSLSDRPQSPTGDNRIDFGRTVCGNPPSKVKKTLHSLPKPDPNRQMAPIASNLDILSSEIHPLCWGLTRLSVRASNWGFESFVGDDEGASASASDNRRSTQWNELVQSYGQIILEMTTKLRREFSSSSSSSSSSSTSSSNTI